MGGLRTIHSEGGDCWGRGESKRERDKRRPVCEARGRVGGGRRWVG